MGSTWDLGNQLGAEGRPVWDAKGEAVQWIADLPAARMVHERYWSSLEQRARHTPHQLIVVHVDTTWDIPHNSAMMKALATFPPAFVRRVVILTMENGLLTEPELYEHTFGHAAARPTFVTMPFAVLTTESQNAATENHTRPFAVMQTGRPNNPSRRALYIQLLEAGAVCRGALARSFDVGTMCRAENSTHCMAWRACQDMGSFEQDSELYRLCSTLLNPDQGLDCILCAEPGGAACRERLMRVSPNKWPDNSNGHVQVDTAIHSTFCLEARSDTAVRSHFYMSLHVGCIP
eukprot:3689506-Prymnesium_polylepis.1